MEGLAVTVSRFAGFCFLPDIDEQRGYDGVSGALVPAFRKELDVSLGLLPPRGFEAKNDKGACAKVRAADTAAVTRLANDLLRRVERGCNGFLPRLVFQIFTRFPH